MELHNQINAWARTTPSDRKEYWIVYFAGFLMFLWAQPRQYDSMNAVNILNDYFYLLAISLRMRMVENSLNKRKNNIEGELSKMQTLLM